MLIKRLRLFDFYVPKKSFRQHDFLNIEICKELFGITMEFVLWKALLVLGLITPTEAMKINE
jgi:hypothetical protein